MSYCQEPQRSEPLERSCINNTPGLLLPVIPLTSEKGTNQVIFDPSNQIRNAKGLILIRASKSDETFPQSIGRFSEEMGMVPNLGNVLRCNPANAILHVIPRGREGEGV